MNEVMQKMVDQYIDANMPSYVQRLYDVASIVSPTGEEANKAHYILDELHKLGAKEAYIDEAGNVVYPHNLPAEGKFPLYTAHMDTVFAGVDKIVPENSDKCFCAPTPNSTARAESVRFISLLISSTRFRSSGDSS